MTRHDDNEPFLFWNRTYPNIGALELRGVKPILVSYKTWVDNTLFFRVASRFADSCQHFSNFSITFIVHLSCLETAELTSGHMFTLSRGALKGLDRYFSQNIGELPSNYYPLTSWKYFQWAGVVVRDGVDELPINVQLRWETERHLLQWSIAVAGIWIRPHPGARGNVPSIPIWDGCYASSDAQTWNHLSIPNDKGSPPHWMSLTEPTIRRRSLCKTRGGVKIDLNFVTKWCYFRCLVWLLQYLMLEIVL